MFGQAEILLLLLVLLLLLLFCHSYACVELSCELTFIRVSPFHIDDVFLQFRHRYLELLFGPLNNVVAGQGREVNRSALIETGWDTNDIT